MDLSGWGCGCSGSDIVRSIELRWGGELGPMVINGVLWGGWLLGPLMDVALGGDGVVFGGWSWTELVFWWGE